MKYLWLFVMSIMLLVGCGSEESTSARAITSDSEMTAVLREAQELSQAALLQASAGEPLSEPMKNDLIHAIKLFDSLISYAPDVMTFYLGKAKIEDALGDRETALQVLLQAARAIPEYVKNDSDRATAAEIQAMAADIQIDRHDYADAMVNIKNARRLVPKNVDYMAVESRILIEKRDYPAARSLVEDGLKLSPEHTRLRQLKKLLEVGAKT